VDFLIVLIVFILVVKGMQAMAKTAEGLDQKNKPKQCPPHTWKWHEQPDMEKTWYMKCTTCGRPPSLSGRDDSGF
jgi:hypothetical protein